VGEKALAAILEARKAGVFLSLDDFTARVNKKAVNSKVVGLLLRAGAFERLGYVEVDSEQRNKNYCELLPYFSALPMLSAKSEPFNLIEHVKLMNEVIAHAWGQSLDYYEPFCGSETASIMIINTLQIRAQSIFSRLFTGLGSKALTCIIRARLNAYLKILRRFQKQSKAGGRTY
jgi:hypothetical protein